MKKHQANFSFRLTWTDLKKISLSLNTKKGLILPFFLLFFFKSIGQVNRLCNAIRW